MAEEEKVGKVFTYFAKPEVAGIELEGPLKVGEKIHIKGKTSDFMQKVESMQIEGEAIEEGKAGDRVGIKVKDRVRPNDVVYKVEG